MTFCLLSFLVCSPPTNPQTHSAQRNNQEYLFAAEFLYTFFIFPDSLPKDTFGFSSPQALYKSVNEPWTRYFSPDSARLFLNSLTTESGGMGVLLDSVAPGFAVKDVYPNSPAQRAGIMKHDTIISVNGTSVSGVSYDSFHGIAGGNIGDVKTITVLRATATITIVVTLGTYLAPSVFSDSLDSTTAYIFLSAFLVETNAPGGTSEELDSALAASRWASHTILDLRGNPGGEIEQCVKVCGRFVPDNSPIIKIHEQFLDTVAWTVSIVDTVLVSSLPGDALSRKFVMLVDDYTASAAEIFISCLKNNRADIRTVGAKTFGKARGQLVYGTPDSGLVKVTYALLTPLHGASYDLVGIVPDISVPPDSDALTVAEAFIAQSTSNGVTKRLAPAPHATGFARINALRKESGHPGSMPLAYKKLRTIM
jgi:C-terminal peptidase prc